MKIERKLCASVAQHPPARASLPLYEVAGGHIPPTRVASQRTGCNDLFILLANDFLFSACSWSWKTDQLDGSSSG